MATGSDALSLTTAEFALVAGLLGATTLVGLPDPFPGAGREAVAAALDRLRASLEERGILTTRRDGRIIIAGAVAGPVSVAAFPEASCLLTLTGAAGETSQHYFHLTRQGAVEMVVHREQPDPRVSLSPCAGAPEVLERIARLCQLGEQAGPAVPGGVVEAEALVAARGLVAGLPAEAGPAEGTETASEGAAPAPEGSAPAPAGGDLAPDSPPAPEGSTAVPGPTTGPAAAQARLEAAGLDPGTAAALVETLAHPVINASLAVVAPQTGRWELGGLGLLLGENGLWQLQTTTREGLPGVALQPVDALTLRLRIQELVQRHLPPAATTGEALA